MKDSAAKILTQGRSEIRLVVFGSVPRGTWIRNKSDIDILIVSKKVSLSAHWQSQTRANILETALHDAFAPFQIHFATPKIYEDWYAKFLKDEYAEIA